MILNNTNIQKGSITIVTTVLEQQNERNSQPLRFGIFESRELPKRSGCSGILATMQNVVVVLEYW
jgi:hypothetical protein